MSLRARPRPRERFARGAAIIALILILILSGGVGSARAADAPRGEALWPVEGPRDIAEPFRPPAHPYGPGHRGVDITAGPGAPVRAPLGGVVAFRGTVVDRPLVTLDHEDGRVTTFEPVASELSPGERVAAGQVLGSVATGGHAPAGSLHLGLRRHGAYLNPLSLFGEVPRSVLLPCCEPL